MDFLQSWLRSSRKWYQGKDTAHAPEKKALRRMAFRAKKNANLCIKISVFYGCLRWFCYKAQDQTGDGKLGAFFIWVGAKGAK